MRKLFWLILTVVLISCKQSHEFEYPLVFTGDVTNITDTSATFTAKISNLGNSTILESGFIWSLYPNNNNGIKIKNEGIFTGIYTLRTNEKLLPGKTYYVRAYIQTASSITYGREVTFKSIETNLSLGKWYNLFSDQIRTDWSEGCDPIAESFTINDTTFFLFQTGQLYRYLHDINTLQYITLTQFLYPGADFGTVYNGNAYIFSKNSFYKFDRHKLSFNKLAILSANTFTNGGKCFLVQDKIYVGLGPAKEFWEYNITSDSWLQVSSFPGESKFFTYSFSINNIGYVGSSSKGEFWSYDPKYDQWLKKENSPFMNGSHIGCANTECCGYCFYDGELYRYNIIFDIWEKVADSMSDLVKCYPYIYTIGDKTYILNIWNSDYTDHLKIWIYEI